MMNNYKTYCDLDGCLVDFCKQVQTIYPDFVEGGTEKNPKMDREMWKAISIYQKKGGKFWLDCDPMPDAMQLWNYLKPYNPEILTACGQAHFGAGQQKIEWVHTYFGPDVKVHLVEKSAHKAKFASPDAILIDDKMKSIEPWRAAGGIGILHTSAADTIRQLRELNIVD